MNNKTAVDWLIEQIEAGKIQIVYSEKIHSISCISSIVEQAKVMHERDIKNAYIAGSYISETRIPEQYYKDTFQ